MKVPFLKMKLAFVKTELAFIKTKVSFIVCCRCTISLVSINGKFTVNQKEICC